MSTPDIPVLIDEIRELSARLAGKQMQLCLALGDRDGAYRHLREMEAQTNARRAAREAQAEESGEQ